MSHLRALRELILHGMHGEFLTYGRLGLEHIADLQGYDHILFVVALTVSYSPQDWRRLLVLVTAFTVGHTVTLVLATTRAIAVSTDWVEFLIPLSIVATALATMARRVERSAGDERQGHRGQGALYTLAGAFGLIHGLGFSTFLRLALGDEESLLVPLLAFNLGLEVGQLAIVLVVMVTGVVACHVVARRHWTLLVGGLIAVVGARMALERVPG